MVVFMGLFGFGPYWFPFPSTGDLRNPLRFPLISGKRQSITEEIFLLSGTIDGDRHLVVFPWGEGACLWPIIRIADFCLDCRTMRGYVSWQRTISMIFMGGA